MISLPSNWVQYVWSVPKFINFLVCWCHPLLFLKLPFLLLMCNAIFSRIIRNVLWYFETILLLIFILIGSWKPLLKIRNIICFLLDENVKNWKEKIEKAILSKKVNNKKRKMKSQIFSVKVKKVLESMEAIQWPLANETKVDLCSGNK